MKSRLLPTLALFSSLIAAVLIGGCFVRLGFDLYMSNDSRAMLLGADVDGGRVRIDLWSNPRPAIVWRLQLHFDKPKFRMADAGRLLWEFAALRFPPGPGGDRFSVLEFPGWVIVLPCLIPPSMWLNRRHRRKIGRGFPVIDSQAI